MRKLRDWWRALTRGAPAHNLPPGGQEESGAFSWSANMRTEGNVFIATTDATGFTDLRGLGRTPEEAYDDLSGQVVGRRFFS